MSQLLGTNKQPLHIYTQQLDLMPTTLNNCQMPSTTDQQTQALWRVRLASAFRTILACTIVACTTLYGPPPVRQLLEYPAFSYVTTILIVSDATLGDALRGCWHALLATLQVMALSVLSLWMIGPGRFTVWAAAAAVAVNAFVVAVPESTHLMCKRIAFGQIVIVYVGAVVHGAKTGALMHPVQVAASTGLGALASVLAMLFPYPHLAYYEVRKTWRLYGENACERLRTFMDAFSAQDNTTALDLISQASSLSKAGAKLLQSIKDNQEGMLWERPKMKFLNRSCIDQGEKLQHIEIPIRGMEMALTSCISCTVSMMDEELREVLGKLEVHIGQKFKQPEFSMPFDAKILDKSLWKFHNISITQKELPVFFFFFCLKLLIDDSPIARILECDTEESGALEKQDVCSSFNRAWGSLDIKPSNQSLVFAFKCSLSLGFAVLFGLIYTKENGYWSGLTIAISFVTGRQPIFTVANARAQGTAMGSVYGILCCFIFQRFEDLRFMLLLPWTVFTSFLMHSRMYGKAGGISAVTGALLILGRKNYGRPSEFAIARITEACIGLICFLIVEILLNPARAATLAKTELSRSLGAFEDWINMVPCSSQKNRQAPTFLALREKQNKLKSHVNELEKFIAEAELEPNFWFLPFHGSCYGKLLRSLLKMVDLLPFLAYQIEFISQVTEISRVDIKELQEHMNNNLELFKKKVSSSLKCLEKVTSIKTLTALEKELQKKIVSHDIELGKLPNANAFIRLLGTNEEEVESIVSPFLQNLNEEAGKICANKGEDKLKSQIVLCLSGLGFCISNLIRETMEIEKEVKELVKWENPSSHVNWNEISCKISALCT